MNNDMLLICLLFFPLFNLVSGKRGDAEKKTCQALCRLKYEGDEAKEVNANRNLKF